MWGKLNEIKKKAVEGLNTATSVATQMAKELILENLEGTDTNPQKGAKDEEDQGDDLKLTISEKKTGELPEPEEQTANERRNEHLNDEEGLDGHLPYKIDHASDHHGETQSKKQNSGDDQLHISPGIESGEGGVEQPPTQSEEGLSKKPDNPVLENTKDSPSGENSDNKNIVEEGNGEKAIEIAGVQHDKVNLTQENTTLGSGKEIQATPHLESTSPNLSSPAKAIEKKHNEEKEESKASVALQPEKERGPISPVQDKELTYTQDSHQSAEKAPKVIVQAPESDDSKIDTIHENSNQSPVSQEKSAATSDKQIKQKVPECKDHLQTIEKLTKENAELITDLSTLTNQLMNTKTAATEANSKLGAAQTHITALSSQLADGKKQASTTIAKHEKEIGLLREEALLYKERIKTLQAWQEDVEKRESKKETERIKRDKDREDKERLEREREREKERTEREARDKVIEELRRRVADLEVQNKTLAGENLKLKDISNDLQELADNNEDEKLKFEAEISKYRKINDGLLKEKERSKKEELILKGQLQEAKDEAAKSKKDLMQQEAEVIKLLEDKEKLKVETSAMIESIKQESQASPKENEDLVAFRYR
jgi:hypothetical protein